MTDIAQERCFNHTNREAAARCPECRRFFCRECVTEHEDRVICCSCLKKIAAGGQPASRRVTLLLLTQCALGFLVLWLIFYYIGQMLLFLPSSFHEGNLWRDIPITL